MHPIFALRRLGPYLVAWIPAAALLAVLLSPGRTRGEAIALAVPLALAAAFVGLGPWAACRANPLGRAPRVRVVAARGLAVAACCVVWLLVGLACAGLLDRDPRFAGALARFRADGLLLLCFGALLFTLAVLAHDVLAALEQARAAERTALELQVLARDAELGALRAQLDPHFLFNSLTAIGSLAAIDAPAAQRMCVRLAAFLRATARFARREEIAFADELALVSAYLDVEQARFGKRLGVETQVAPEAETCGVPPLVLQPLVENAVRHGIAHLLEGGTIRITAQREAGTLALRVENPCAADRPRTAGGGLGLANVRARLGTLHAGAAEVSVHEADGHFRVDVRLPARDVAPSTVEAASR